MSPIRMIPWKVLLDVSGHPWIRQPTVIFYKHVKKQLNADIRNIYKTAEKMSLWRKLTSCELLRKLPDSTESNTTKKSDKASPFIGHVTRRFEYRTLFQLGSEKMIKKNNTRMALKMIQLVNLKPLRNRIFVMEHNDQRHQPWAAAKLVTRGVFVSQFFF